MSTCGDHGGRKRNGGHCKREAGWGTDTDEGRCRQHPEGGHGIDAEQVKNLAGVGLTQEQIGDFFGFTGRTLRRKLAEDEVLVSAYKSGRANGIGNIAKTLYQKAVAGDTTAMIFYLKAQAGWSTKHEIKHSGELPVFVVTKDDGE